MREVSMSGIGRSFRRLRPTSPPTNGRLLERHPSGAIASVRSVLTCYVVVDTGRWGAETLGSPKVLRAEPEIAALGGDMAKVRRSTATKEAGTEAVAAPRKVRESDWALKIARARQVREAAKKARKGKPATFPNRLVP